MNESVTTSSLPSRRLTSRILLGATLTLLGVVLLVPRLLDFAGLSTALVAWPWQFDYTEGVNLNASVRLAGGENIYAHNGADGFLSAPYPPLFYLLTAPLIWFSGPSFVGGRALSLLVTVLIAGLLVYVVGRVTHRWSAGLLTGGLWLALAPVIVWAAQYKQDMLALGLGLAGVAWALTVRTERRVYGAAVCFALAFYTKQSAIDAAAATTLWLFLRDWRVGLRFAALLAGLIVGPFLVVDQLLGGGWTEHLIGNHALPWSARRFGRTLNRLVAEYWPLLIAGSGTGLVGLIGAARWGWRLRQAAARRAALGQPWMLAAIYLGGSTVTTLTRIGYEGANYNHLLDGLLPLCLLLGLSLGHLLGRAEPGAGRPGPARLALAGGALLLVVQLTTFQDPHTWYRGTWPNPAADRQMRTLSRLVANTPGDIYSEDAYLILSNRRRVLYDDPSTFVPLANLNKWDERVFVQSLRDRRFGLVILQPGSGRWTPLAAQALDDNYQLQFPDIVDTYVPRSSPRSPQYMLRCMMHDGDEAVMMEGVTLAPGVAWQGIKPGDVLRVTLHWRAHHRLRANFASFVHLLNEQGEQVAGQDNPATGAAQPPTAWSPDQLTDDVAAIPIPAQARPGRYRLVQGMYRVENGTIRQPQPQCPRPDLVYGTSVSAAWIEVKSP